MIMCTKGRIGPSITKTSDFIAKNVKSTLYYGHNFFATHLGLKSRKNLGCKWDSILHVVKKNFNEKTLSTDDSFGCSFYLSLSSVVSELSLARPFEYSIVLSSP